MELLSSDSAFEAEALRSVKSMEGEGKWSPDASVHCWKPCDQLQWRPHITWDASLIRFVRPFSNESMINHGDFKVQGQLYYFIGAIHFAGRSWHIGLQFIQYNIKNQPHMQIIVHTTTHKMLFDSLIIAGRNTFLNLFVWPLCTICWQPEGSSSHSVCRGRVKSDTMASAFFRQP